MVEYTTLVLNNVFTFRQIWKCSGESILASMPRLDCGERLFFSPIVLSFEHFVRSETRII